MASHWDLVNLRAGSGYDNVRIMVDWSAIHTSFLLIVPVRRPSAHDIVAFIILWICSFKFPSGARKTPKVSYAWWGSNLLTTFLLSAISFTNNSPGESWIPSYDQLVPDHLKLTSHQTVFSGTRAPQVAFKLNSYVSIACCNRVIAVFGDSFREDWMTSMSSTKA